MVRGDEAAVVAAFAEWLRVGGWSVRTEVEFADVVAERDGARLICEAKGRSSDPGTDLDTAYGQLLRRIPVDDDPAVRFGLVVRDEPRSLRAALRVGERVRTGQVEIPQINHAIGILARPGFSEYGSIVDIS